MKETNDVEVIGSEVKALSDRPQSRLGLPRPRPQPRTNPPRPRTGIPGPRLRPRT